MANCDRCDGTFERLISKHDKIFKKLGEVDIVDITEEITKSTLDWIKVYNASQWMTKERAYTGTYHRIHCNDGFSMSVQAGTHIYSTPHCCVGPWSQCEVGFPTQKENALMGYINDEQDPRESVYSYVPAEAVLYIIKRHGGIKTGVLPCLALSNGDEMHRGVVITASLDPKLLT